MERKINGPQSWREVYYRHRRAWIMAALFALGITAIITWGVYEVWFAPLGSEPLFDDRVISKIIVGAIAGWALTYLIPKEKK